MTSILQTAEDALAALSAVVEARGTDYVYESPVTSENLDDVYGSMLLIPGSCVYRKPDGSPSCVVGQVVFDLFGQEELDRIIEGVPAHSVAANLGVSSAAAHVLSRAQRAQDKRMPYGKMLELAADPIAFYAWAEAEEVSK